MTDLQAKIVKALARNDMNVSETARGLHYHRNTLMYQIEKIKKETGLNPIKFYDLGKLLILVEG